MQLHKQAHFPTSCSCTPTAGKHVLSLMLGPQPLLKLLVGARASPVAHIPQIPQQVRPHGEHHLRHVPPLSHLPQVLEPLVQQLAVI